MTSLRDQPQQWRQAAMQLLRADPKRSVALAVLALVLLVLGGRLLLGGGGPAPAGASLLASHQADSQQLLAGNDASRPKADSSLQAWLAGHARREVSRNLFQVKMDYFQTDGTAAGEASSDSGGFWDEVAKSMARQADQKKSRQILVENLEAEAEKLRLQSTMMGSSPQALIDGQLVHEGDMVSTFRIVRIEARRIVLEREGVRLAISMQ